MSRQLRLQYPGSLWHITVRGNERRDIVRDDADRGLFIDLLGRAVRLFDWILPAYVLMDNHFHLLLRLTAATLSRGMQWLNGEYARSFNRRHHRVGHLVQGRFHGILIDEQAYFLEVARYIVLNPVRARMVRKAEDYRWSSHRAVLGLVDAPDWLAVDDLLVNFAKTAVTARSHYQQFVAEGIKSGQRPWDHVVGQIYLGSSEWVDNVREKIDLQPRSDDHPRLQREIPRLTIADVVTAVGNAWAMDPNNLRRRRGGNARMVVAWIGCYEAHLTRREIAAGLRLCSAGHVSDLIRRCDRALETNRALQAAVDRCVSTLRGENRQPKL